MDFREILAWRKNNIRRNLKNKTLIARFRIKLMDVSTE